MGNGGRTRSCPNCTEINPEDSRFCRSCGAPLPSDHETLPYPPLTPTPAGSAAAPSSGLRFAPGAAFGVRYRIIEEVGSGGMGRVYKAEDKELGTTVALKMIRPELAADPAVIERFKTEVRLARSISHDNVVRIHDLGEIGGVKYVSMDFIKGEDLKSLIRLSGALSVDTALKIALQAGEALRAAHHKNIVHQDLKPQNIMLGADGRVFVTDFGLATLRAGSGAEDVPAGIVGTPLYVSPEQARGAPADPRSDIYSFGVVLYEMLAGREPFRAATAAELARKHESEHPTAPSRFNPAVPAALEKIVLKCLAKKREDRYQSFEGLLAELRKLKPDSGGAPRKTLGRRLLPWIPAALFVLAAAIAGLKLFGPREEQRPATSSLRSPLKRFSIAVLDAVNYTGDPSLDYLSGLIQELLCTDLLQSRYIGVLSTDRLYSALADAERPGLPRHATEALERIAGEEGVEYFIFPSFMRLGESFRVDVKVRRAGAKEIMDTAQADGDSVPSLIDALTPQLKSILRLSKAEIDADDDREVRQITTDSPQALREFMEGKRLYLERKFVESNRAFARAVNADPEFALAYNKMAANYFYMGDIANSRAQILKALELLDRLSERDRFLIQGFASALLDESPDKAIASYEQLLENKPGDEEGHILLGSIFRNLERWDDAEQQFEILLDLNPRSDLAIENLAFIRAGKGTPAQAVSLVQSHFAMFPRSSLLTGRLALLFMIQGRLEESRVELDAILHGDPPNDTARELEACLLQLEDKLEAAHDAFERLEESQDPVTACAGRQGVSQIALLRGGFARARKTCRLGLDLALKSGRRTDALFYNLFLARIELAQGRWADAAAAARAASDVASEIVYMPEKKIALMLGGIAEAGAGRTAEAEAAAEALRELIDRTGCPTHARYLYALKAALALQAGSPAMAVEWQDKAVALLPGQIDKFDDHAPLYYDLGRMLEAAELPDKALAVYERLAALTTGRLRAGDRFALGFYRTGVISEARGEFARAAAAYRRFLSYWGAADPDLPEPADARRRLKRLVASDRTRTSRGTP